MTALMAARDLHTRGLECAGQGQWESATGLLAAAVEAAPGERVYRCNLGLALVRAGRLEEAVVCYRAALELAPGHSPTLAKLGRALSQSGHAAEAIGVLEQALAADPGDAGTANALGAALALDARLAPARRCFERAVALEPGFGEAWRNLGLLEAEAGGWVAAVRALERAVMFEPPTAGLWYQLGVAQARAGLRAPACEAYRRALELDTAMPEAWNNLGHQLAAGGDCGAALDCVTRALRARPDFVEARYNLGVTLQSLGRLAEARIAYQLVLAAAGAHADALNNLGGLCLSEGAPELAAPLYERARAANPRHPEAQWNLGLAQLASGDWENGWRNYEARSIRRTFPAPRWSASGLSSGHSVLVWCEQGLGDGIQFLRYVDRVRALGAGRICVECPAPLAGLLALAEGVDEVIVRGCAPSLSVDSQIALMSLPFELGVRPESVPPPGPAYRLCGLRRAEWRARLAGLGADKRKIGLVWGGNPANAAGLHRSLSLAALAPALIETGVALVSLQHGPQHSELAAFAGAIAGWPQQDLADTAALAAELDLVVTVDTMMAHLAGTLGRPTWVLLPYAADWRWMTGRGDSPWYPSMRLFRQKRSGDWGPVLLELAAELDRFCRGAERGVPGP